jgi:hypothetical protein
MVVSKRLDESVSTYPFSEPISKLPRGYYDEEGRRGQSGILLTHERSRVDLRSRT